MNSTNQQHAQPTIAHQPMTPASALHAFRTRYAWNWHDLARWLGVSVDQLDVLACEPLAETPVPRDNCDELARRHAVDATRLASILSR